MMMVLPIAIHIVFGGSGDWGGQQIEKKKQLI